MWTVCNFSIVPFHNVMVPFLSWTPPPSSEQLDPPQTSMSHICLCTCSTWIPRDTVSDMYRVIPFSWRLDLCLLVSCLPVFLLNLSSVKYHSSFFLPFVFLKRESERMCVCVCVCVCVVKYIMNVSRCLSEDHQYLRKVKYNSPTPLYANHL